MITLDTANITTLPQAEGLLQHLQLLDSMYYEGSFSDLDELHTAKVRAIEGYLPKK